MNPLLYAHVVDGDLHTKLQDIAYSTSLRETFTIEKMIAQYELEERVRMAQQSIEERRIILSKWLGVDVSNWSSKRVMAVYSKEYYKRSRIYAKEAMR